ncbi:mevalonate kinase [Patescibacteria group bacterium]|nr:mevalonate kinase [Patescibacteria group bacterium]
MKKIIVSAPGKLMLLGEHAVVYNKPCLVTAVDQRLRLTIEVLNIQEFQLDAPDVDTVNYKKQIVGIGKGNIPKGAKFVEFAIKNFLDRTPLTPFIKGGVRRTGDLRGIKITTKSEFSSRFGFGSSSASVVCVIKAMSELFNLNLSPKEIFDLSYKTVLDVQGAGSGFDVAAAVYGGTVYFIKGGITIEQLNISNLPLIIGYSGIKTDTVTLINQVKEKAEKYPKIIEGIYSSIEELVELAKVKLLANDLRSFGELMNINQGYLDALGVSINKLADMIYASRIAGAYGAKLSGAGGGDCIIAIAPEEKRISVEKAIQQAGGEVIKVKTNAKGVKVE